MPDTACPASLEGGLVGIRPIVLAAPVLALFAASTSAEVQPVDPVPIATIAADPCPGGRFTQRTHFHYTSRVFRTRSRVSRRARRHMKLMRDCSLSARAARNMRHLERLEARVRRERKAVALAVPPQLSTIAACESGGDPTAISAGGTYRGKYQFDFSTWRSVGGVGDPAQAPEAVQDELAGKLYRRSGARPWPVCGA